MGTYTEEIKLSSLNQSIAVKFKSQHFAHWTSLLFSYPAIKFSERSERSNQRKCYEEKKKCMFGPQLLCYGKKKKKKDSTYKGACHNQILSSLLVEVEDGSSLSTPPHREAPS